MWAPAKNHDGGMVPCSGNLAPNEKIPFKTSQRFTGRESLKNLSQCDRNRAQRTHPDISTVGEPGGLGGGGFWRDQDLLHKVTSIKELYTLARPERIIRDSLSFMWAAAGNLANLWRALRDG